MALTTPRGPLGTEPAGWFHPPIPESTFVEPHPRRIQAELDGQIVLDTEHAVLIHRPNRYLQYGFPVDVVGDLPNKPDEAAPGYVRVPWGAVDKWFEEGRHIPDYPPNPYHRIDCHPTVRRLTVKVGDTVVVDTDDTLILFETTLPHRLYVDRSRISGVVLRETETTSWCNYKGRATYWAVEVDGVVIEDAAWSYEEPLPEATPIAGMLSFDEAKVDVTAALPPAY